MEPIRRVTITEDCDWETGFIPWLEGMEKDGVGTADGVFVATIHPSLRILQPGDEGAFLRNCINSKLTDVVQIYPREFMQDGIFEYRADRADLETFKKKISSLHSYKGETCCTPFVEQGQGLYDDLFSHLNSVLHQVKKSVPCSNGLGSTKSKVLLEEAGLKIEKLYEKYRQSTSDFGWERCQKEISHCPDMECVVPDETSSDDSGEPEICTAPARKRKRRRLNDTTTDRSICYGYGYESPSDSIKVTPKLDLCRIFNLLWLLPQHFPGLHSTFLYFGACHSFFSIHVEDGLTLSVNYLHIGHPKVWIFVPPHATQLLKFHLQRSTIHLSHTHCHNVLGHKAFFPTTSWLKARKIPYKVLVQRPGDMVVIYPQTPHAGFNTGPNIAQAINVATKAWIPYGINAKKCICLKDSVHLDMTPLVAAFRKDLLSSVLCGKVISTPAMLQGVEFLKDSLVTLYNEQGSGPLQCITKNEISNAPVFSQTLQHNDTPHEKQELLSTIKCPALSCKRTFCKSDGKRQMVQHVRSTHRPILESSHLLSKIDQLYQD